MAYLVTLKAGLSNVSLPNGLIAQGSQIALLTEEQYVRLSPTAVAALFSAVTVADPATVPVTTVGAQTPQIYGYMVNGVWTLDNPLTESASR